MVGCRGRVGGWGKKGKKGKRLKVPNVRGRLSPRVLAMRVGGPFKVQSLTAVREGGDDL